MGSLRNFLFQLYRANNALCFSVVTRDSECQSQIAMGNAVDLWYNYSIDAFIGPPCSIGKL